MDKHRFDDAIGAAPPSTVDVDAIVTRQRRRTVIQRAVALAVVAAAAVVAIAPDPDPELTLFPPS